MDIEEDINKINERFNNGTETIDDILNYCKNYRFTFENGTKMRLVEKKHVDRLIDEHKKLLAEREQDKKRIKELEEMNKEILNSKIGIDLSYQDYIPKQKVKELKESVILNNTIVGGRRNAKTLEYGIKLGKIKACEELLEDK